MPQRINQFDSHRGEWKRRFDSTIYTTFSYTKSWHCSIKFIPQWQHIAFNSVACDQLWHSYLNIYIRATHFSRICFNSNLSRIFITTFYFLWWRQMCTISELLKLNVEFRWIKSLFIISARRDEISIKKKILLKIGLFEAHSKPSLELNWN